MKRSCTVVAAAVLGLALAAPAADAAWRAPCLAGTLAPDLHVVAGQGHVRRRRGHDPRATTRLGRVRTVRFTGINAMELRRFSSRPSRRRGACHAVAAAAVVQRAVRRSHRVVRLAAQRSGSRTGGRLRRSVFARVGGAWVDVSRLVLERGLALWLPNAVEDAHNLEYRLLAELVAAAHRGLYDPAGCGAGPDQDLPLGVTVNWYADGNDERNLDGEWIAVANGGPRDLPLAGWFVRDSWLNIGAHGVPGHAFPAAPRVPAGGSVACTSAAGATPRPTSTGASAPRRSRTSPTTAGTSATAATSSTRRATCGRR